ncbi:calcium/sodium antiporter [Tissierella creatinophila]|uniref:Inner membrane protein YrbG n=1 Tax=Tissierella creatinophila DSM 6911 TaxID=1123403 RepID=A0A1U7M2D4_TISCR|nr:calcium/sodium antiporter [Tissierella creatinophila]OLS01472.1 inner membrane protein YrbG [Tissierella creatinophila DSM 6911]
MANYLIYILFIMGLIMILKGGDWFVDSAIWFGEITGASMGLIGITLISFATTLPEFFVSTLASKDGLSEIAVGNSIGSIICNIAVVISICVIFKPIKIEDSKFDSKALMMIVFISIFYFLASDGLVTKIEGFILVTLTIPFMLLNFYQPNKSKITREKINFKDIKVDLNINILKFLIGGFLIIYGADILVNTGVEIANILRIPKKVVSLTLLALGTSLPELTASLTATLKNKPDISVGNILGANILNITSVLGVSALVHPTGLRVMTSSLTTDIPVAILFMLIFTVPGMLRKKIGRFTGILLFSSYVVYIINLF